MLCMQLRTHIKNGEHVDIILLLIVRGANASERSSIWKCANATERSHSVNVRTHRRVRIANMYK